MLVLQLRSVNEGINFFAEYFKILGAVVEISRRPHIYLVLISLNFKGKITLQ